MLIQNGSDGGLSDITSDDEPYDSDKIDSDVEAELYSFCHHDTTPVAEQTSDTVDNLNELAGLISNHETSKSSKIDNFKNNNRAEFTNKLFDCNLNKSSPTQNQKLPKKRKSDVVSNILKSIQSTSKKHKTNHENITLVQENLTFAPENITLVQGNDNTIVLSSSGDDDSDIIWTNPAETNTLFQTKLSQNSISVLSSSDDDDSDIIWTSPTETNTVFQTNLSQNNISVDLDSDSDDRWCHKFSKETNANKQLKDPWHINNEDLYRNRKSPGRYHESRLLNCSNCSQKGHVAKFCTNQVIRKCFLCGLQHNPSNCKNSLCIKCYRSGHNVKYCRWPILSCSRCRMLGHSAEACPDIWRRYQLTTAKKFIKSQRMHQNTPLYCYSCGYSGHFGGECKDFRTNNVFGTWPTLINYEIPDEMTHKKTFNQGLRDADHQNSSFVEQFIANKSYLGIKKTKAKKLKKVKKAKADGNQVGVSQENNSSQNFPRTPKKTITDNHIDTIKSNRKEKNLRRKERRKQNKALRKLNSSFKK